ncbi:hypothetical protein KP509_09G064800 [Ceratopteris richardii]|uniref:Uncharacterized protein n=1 Tax=Ceratopteris richardii TaxID=49495 RepID=A0A8T2U8Q7_CERRI|nr:hypothetical protein KP509_09G064800 [Ceratopteris richardii]
MGKVGELSIRFPTLRPSVILFLLSLLLLNFGYLRVSDASLAAKNSEFEEERGILRHQGRTLLQSNISVSFLVLAQDRTERPDPLDHFNTYREGWDVRNEHYWASVGYTGAPGFILAGAWLAFGLVTLLVLCFCCCCCSRQLKGSHQGGILFPLVLLLILTGVAVVGCFLVYDGQGKAHDQLSSTLDYVVGESKTVVVKLQNTSAILTESESIDVLRFTLSDSRKTKIKNLNVQLNAAANTLETQTKDNADNISFVLDKVRLAMIVVAGVMLLLLLLGFLFSVLGMTALMYLLVFVAWILVAGTWILCGVYILLNNVIGDTCVSMEEWVANPSAKTNLADILPCVDVNTTDRALEQTRATMNETLTGINSVITSNLNNGSQTKGLPLMCNPLEPSLNVPGCADVDRVSQKWLPYVCNNSGASQACPLAGRLTPQLYGQLNSSASIINRLNDSIPFLLDLANCQFVRQVFTDIRVQHCHSLLKYLKWQYIGLALISGGFMFTIWLWIVINRRRKHRFFHHSKEMNAQFIARGASPHEAVPPKHAT